MPDASPAPSMPCSKACGSTYDHGDAVQPARSDPYLPAVSRAFFPAPFHRQAVQSRDEHDLRPSRPRRVALARQGAEPLSTASCMPLEVEAEMNEGRIPEHRASAMNALRSTWGSPSWMRPRSTAAWRCRSSPRSPFVEQFGRVTNALGWCYRRSAGLDVRGLQRRSGRALCHADRRAAKSTSATPSPRRMPAPIPIAIDDHRRARKATTISSTARNGM